MKVSSAASQTRLLSNLSSLDKLGNFANSGSVNSPLSNVRFDLKDLGNLFAGKSILGAVAVSMVDNVSLSGVQLINESTLSVTMSHRNGINHVLPVTVIAYKISLNNSDIGTIVKSMSNNILVNSYNNNLQSNNNMTDIYNPQTSDVRSNQSNPLAIFEKIQIGSSSLTKSDWASPHILSMGMIKNTNHPSNLDFIFVMAIPYTGVES